MAFNAGKAVGDLFATKEEYSKYEQAAPYIDFGGIPE